MTDAISAGPPPVPGRSRSRRGQRLIAGRRVRRWLTDILLLAIGTTSVVVEPFSIAIHSLIGLAFVALVWPHLWDRRHWISSTLTGIRRHRRIAARRQWSLGQAALLLVVAVTVTVSGLWDWLGTPTRIRYHAISGVVLIGVAAWHGWARRRALIRWPSGLKRFAGRLARCGKTP